MNKHDKRWGFLYLPVNDRRTEFSLFLSGDGSAFFAFAEDLNIKARGLLPGCCLAFRFHFLLILFWDITRLGRCSFGSWRD